MATKAEKKAAKLAGDSNQYAAGATDLQLPATRNLADSYSEGTKGAKVVSIIEWVKKHKAKYSDFPNRTATGEKVKEQKGRVTKDGKSVEVIHPAGSKEAIGLYNSRRYGQFNVQMTKTARDGNSPKHDEALARLAIFAKLSPAEQANQENVCKLFEDLYKVYASGTRGGGGGSRTKEVNKEVGLDLSQF